MSVLVPSIIFIITPLTINNTFKTCTPRNQNKRGLHSRPVFHSSHGMLAPHTVVAHGTIAIAAGRA